MSILDYLTNEWQTMAELERRAGRPIAAQMLAMVAEGKVWRMVDYSMNPCRAKYCKPHRVPDTWIGTSHVGRIVQGMAK